MSRIFDVGMAILSWENNNLRKLNECLDKGCPPGLVAELKQALQAVITTSEPTLTQAEIDWLVEFEFKGHT